MDAEHKVVKVLADYLNRDGVSHIAEMCELAALAMEEMKRDAEDMTDAEAYDVAAGYFRKFPTTATYGKLTVA